MGSGPPLLYSPSLVYRRSQIADFEFSHFSTAEQRKPFFYLSSRVFSCSVVLQNHLKYFLKISSPFFEFSFSRGGGTPGLIPPGAEQEAWSDVNAFYTDRGVKFHGGRGPRMIAIFCLISQTLLMLGFRHAAGAPKAPPPPTIVVLGLTGDGKSNLCTWFMGSPGSGTGCSPPPQVCLLFYFCEDVISV